MTIFYAVSAVAVILVGIGKAGFAAGLTIIAVPMMIVAMPEGMDAGAAPAILLPILCGCDWFSLAHYRKEYSSKHIFILLPGALLGILAGWLFMRIGKLSGDFLKVGIGILSIGFVVFSVWREFIQKKTSASTPGKIIGSIIGVVTGFSSMLAHAGGPPIAVYLLPQNLNRRIFVGTTVVFFTILNHVKLIPYYQLGLLDFSNVKISLFLAPLVPVGVYLGVWMNRRVDESSFKKIVTAFLLVSGVKLLWDGLF